MENVPLLHKTPELPLFPSIRAAMTTPLDPMLLPSSVQLHEVRDWSFWYERAQQLSRFRSPLTLDITLIVKSLLIFNP